MSIFNNNKTGPWSVNDVYDKIKTDEWIPFDPDAPGELYVWGGTEATMGLNSPGVRTAPAQIPGDSWTEIFTATQSLALKDNGTLWSWGYNSTGDIGDNTVIKRSSPVQIPGTAWCRVGKSKALKSDSTLWVWGFGGAGVQGTGGDINRSSPIQLPGSWCDIRRTHALKSNGTLWSWGYNGYGAPNVGDNTTILKLSPVQIPGTNWASINGTYAKAAIKTDGTLWRWGGNTQGQLGVGDAIPRSSPIQIPGTWVLAQPCHGIKADGTLWGWGPGLGGLVGDGNFVPRSSPTQIPGTNWFTLSDHPMAIKGDGSLWIWGGNSNGRLGIGESNTSISVASPVSIPGQWSKLGKNSAVSTAFKGKV
jgi:alpha-tubulin suppressor-like RCC1 family protein